MNRKAKITLNLSAVALALAIGAQFYTNYKIDRTLQQFPYHLKEQFTIQVDEKNSDFFTRDLTFSIKHKDDGEPIEFIQTKLIALPFAITAQSEISSALIKKANKALNITIDKNTISSQFSVVGDYLQSDIITEFRDVTNSAQVMETKLMYSAKNGSLSARTDLSGLNYDANSKIKGVSGKFLLQPIRESYYDITEADIDIANIDILLLDGENSRFELEKTAYTLDKSIDRGGYNLTTGLKNQLIRFSNKNTQTEQDKSTIEGLEISTKQLAVPNHITFYDRFNELNIDNLNLQNLIKQLTDTLFNNDLFEFNLTLKNFTIPDGIDIKNTAVNILLNNGKKEDTEQKFSLDLDEINIYQKEPGKGPDQAEAQAAPQKNNLPINIRGIKWNYDGKHLNISEHLAFLHKYIPEKMDDITYYAKDNPEFLTDLKALAGNYKAQTKTRFAVKSIANPKYFSAENIVLNYNEASADNNFTLALNGTFDKFALETENVQFEKFNFSLPLKLNPITTVYPLYMCSSNRFNLLCADNLSYPTYQQLQNEVFGKTSGGIETAAFNIDINTLPATKSQTVNGKLSLVLSPQADNAKPLFSPLFQSVENADITAGLTVPVALISDIGDSELDSGKLKNGYFWRWLQEGFGADNPLMRLATVNNDQYEFEFVQKDGKYRINGTDLAEFEKSLEEEEKRRKEEAEKEAAEQSAEEQSAITKDDVAEAVTETPPEESQKADSESEKTETQGNK